MVLVMVSPEDGGISASGGDDAPLCSPGRSRWAIVAGVVGLVGIAAIVGGVLGTRQQDHSSQVST